MKEKESPAVAAAQVRFLAGVPEFVSKVLPLCEDHRPRHRQQRYRSQRSKPPRAQHNCRISIPDRPYTS